jgi:hypothetical protein
VNLREVACVECGSVNEPATQLLNKVRQELAESERDLRAKRSQITALRSEQEEALSARPQFTDAMTVLTYWRQECMPSARELASGDRLAHCIARLRGTRGSKYTKDDLLVSVDGYARFPYVTRRGRAGSGTPAEWRADAELIFRSPQHVDQGIRLAKEQVHYSPESLALVPWREARTANRRAFCLWLQHYHGAYQTYGDLLWWPCPTKGCDGKLWINKVNSMETIARCVVCEMNDDQLMDMVQKLPVPPIPPETT